MRAIYKIVEVKSPIHGIERGWRIKLAVHNAAHFNEKAQKWVPSFIDKYLINESGDYTDFDTAVFKKWLDHQCKWHKIDHLECY